MERRRSQQQRSVADAAKLTGFSLSDDRGEGGALVVVIVVLLLLSRSADVWLTRRSEAPLKDVARGYSRVKIPWRLVCLRSYSLSYVRTTPVRSCTNHGLMHAGNRSMEDISVST